LEGSGEFVFFFFFSLGSRSVCRLDGVIWFCADRKDSDDIVKLGDADAAQLGLPQTTTARVVQWRESLRQ